MRACVLRLAVLWLAEMQVGSAYAAASLRGENEGMWRLDRSIHPSIKGENSQVAMKGEVSSWDSLALLIVADLHSASFLFKSLNF